MIINANILDWAASYDGPLFHALLCDAPYEMEFMGKSWDNSGIAFNPETWRMIARCLHPGAFLFVFAGTINDDLISVAMRQAGLRKYHKSMAWGYGCLSEDTEILTSNGWEPYHKAIEGTDVLCYNRHCDALEWHSVQELLVYDYDETAYHIRSANTDQIVSRNHRCLVERGGQWAFEYAEKLEALECVPVLASMQSVRERLHSAQLPRGRQTDLFAGMCAGSYRGPSSSHLQASRSTQGRNHHMPGVWWTGMETQCLVAQDQNGILFSIMPIETRALGAINCKQIRSHRHEVSRRGIEGRGESSMEGRCNLLQETWQLCRCEVCALPSRVHRHGPQGWLCDGASAIRSTGDWSLSTTLRSGASYRPQSSQQRPEEFAAVRQQSRSQAPRAPRVAIPDLATVTPVHYRGKVWCVRVPTGAFVARRNGQIFITGNSGFPKATDLPAQIDERAFQQWLAAHDEERATLMQYRDAVQTTRAAHKANPTLVSRALVTAAHNAYRQKRQEVKKAAGFLKTNGTRRHQPKFDAAGFEYREKDNGYNSKERETFDVTVPATDLAQTWDGYSYGGQMLKPALESLLIFQKSYEGAPVDCITRTGAGALWIDGGRIGTDGERPSGSGDRRGSPIYAQDEYTQIRMANGGNVTPDAGRWPANLILSHSPDCNGACAPDCPVRRLGEQSGETPTGTFSGHRNTPKTAGIYGGFESYEEHGHIGDSGTAARYFFQADYMYERLEAADPLFYCAKADRAEREAGLDPRQVALLGMEEIEGDNNPRAVSYGGNHTVNRCLEHGESIPSGSTSYRCGCPIVRGRQYFTESTINDGRQKPIDNPYQRGETTRRNIHPTLKPLSLCRYLAMLLLPPAMYAPRRLLVPFSGAASEYIGALLAGWDEIVGVELEPDYCRIAEARAAYWAQRRHEFLDPSKPIAVKLDAAPDGQLDMFMDRPVYVSLDEWLAKTAAYGGTAEEWHRIYGKEAP